ncbi:glycosyltransferase [Stenotrophomonas rhizophila]|jgi:glycosyltransferase involved in cell wall biosynthesis
MTSAPDQRPIDFVAVVIPCYKVTQHIVGVVNAIGPEVERIYCVDDACPDNSGDMIERDVHDPRVVVIRHTVNQGVGGAVLTGYARAIGDGARVMVKIDGDGQMDPSLLTGFINPILRGEADYTKGNRFWDLREIRQMPLLRRVGNLGLSFMSKASTGYWDIFDPTNGYTAIHADIASRLPVDSISKRYFFETDMLFRLNTMRAVVVDVPMDARYADETSGLKITSIVGEFMGKHIRNFFKRIAYNYFLRDLPVASLELIAGVGLGTFGIVFGGWHWWHSAQQVENTPVGTIMIATVAVVSGLQFLLAFLNYDIANVPRRPLHPLMGKALPRRTPAA